MEDRIKESKEICRKRDEKPLEREPLSNSLYNYLHAGVENIKMQEGEKKQWIVISGIMRAGLDNENLSEHIQEVKDEYE